MPCLSHLHVLDPTVRYGLAGGVCLAAGKEGRGHGIAGRGGEALHTILLRIIGRRHAPTAVLTILMRGWCGEKWAAAQ